MKILCLLVCVVASACVEGRAYVPNGRIVGGQNVDIAKYGWQVSLMRNGKHICGASILNNNWVVTAAHCISKDLKYTIRAGSSVRNVGGSIHAVEEVIVHPDYEGDGNDNDVAILRVGKPFRLNGRTIRRVKLTGKEQDAPTGSEVIITGWGTLQEGGNAPDQLQAVRVPIVEWKKCRNIYEEYFNKITENMICAGFEDGGKDSCQGDSGGPVVNDKGELIGIVSWGRGCARPEIPGVYTRVASPSVRDFIRKHTRL